MMREARLARPWRVASPDQPSVGNRVVRSSKWPAPDECAPRRERPRDGVDGGDLESLGLAERGKDAWQPSREHGLPCARRPGEQCIVAPRRSDLESTLGALLSSDVAQVVYIFRDRQPRR